jgi:hypothetical protein
MLSDYLRNTYGVADRDAKLRAARENAAHLLAEHALEIADAAKPEDAQVARLQVSTRQWVAERWNRKEFGQDRSSSAVVNVSIGSLMLDALRQPVAIEAPAIVGAIAEPAEVLSTEPAMAYEDAERIPNPSTAAADQLSLGIEV